MVNLINLRVMECNNNKCNICKWILHGLCLIFVTTYFVQRKGKMNINNVIAINMIYLNNYQGHSLSRCKYPVIQLVCLFVVLTWTMAMGAPHPHPRPSTPAPVLPRFLSNFKAIWRFKLSICFESLVVMMVMVALDRWNASLFRA